MNEKIWLFSVLALLLFCVGMGCDSGHDAKDAQEDEEISTDETIPVTFLFVIRPHRADYKEYPWEERRDDSLLDGTVVSQIEMISVDEETETFFSVSVEPGIDVVQQTVDVRFNKIENIDTLAYFRDVEARVRDENGSIIGSYELTLRRYFVECPGATNMQPVAMHTFAIELLADGGIFLYDSLAWDIQAAKGFQMSFSGDVPDDRLQEIGDDLGFVVRTPGWSLTQIDRLPDAELLEKFIAYHRYLEFDRAAGSCNYPGEDH